MASTDLKRLYKSGATNVLALLQAGKLSLIRKRLSSVFEQTVVAPNNTDATIRPVPTSFSSGTLRLLPLVCSDALITHHVRGEFDASAILAFDQHPEQFMPYITQEVRNKRPVLFCNDGSVGGTNIHSSDDLRRPSWLRDALPTGLPAGDSFMIVDLDIAVRAVEVGTSLPGQSIQLISIGSIIHSDAVGATAASELSEIANLSEATARSGELKRLLKTTLLTHLQRLRMRHLVDLEARGEPHAAWWRCMVSDVLLPELLSLTALEARLAARCARHLMGRLNNPDTISRIGPLLS
ncbi:MAG TPA: hypothetical protein VN999_19285, partial [Thermoanaerobaculia bacterium]|nr:hypothetical protein [Thermoanaerobaculia bacterium]